MYDLREGHLAVGTTRSSGKIIDEWKFVSPFRDGKDPKLVVQVSIDKSERDGITFRAKGECLPKPIDETDIERLRQKVESELRFQHHMLTGVTWEDWLEIEVRGRRDAREDGKGRWQSEEGDLQVRYQWLKRGVYPETGKAYVINTNGIAVDFPTPKKSGELDEGETWGEWRGMNRRDEEAEYSYLPATSENVAALNELMGRLDALRAKLSEFMRQDVVQGFLADLRNRLPALTAPE